MPNFVRFLQLKRHRNVKFVNRQNLTVTHNSPGFTLIELLVVIAIIGILVVIVVVAINPVNRLKEARDTVRKTDIDSIAKRLMVYRLDNGQFPASKGDMNTGLVCWDLTSFRGWEFGSASNNDFILDLKNADNKKVPVERSPITTDHLISLEGPEPDIHLVNSDWDWSECNYRYLRAENYCLSGQTWAIIYTWLETPSGEKDIRPTIFDTCPIDAPPHKDKDWDESAPGTKTDKYDWVIFMLE